MDIAAQIPPRARRVVELGALREKAGEAFLRMQPQAEYFGIASSKEEAQEAGSFLTHAFYVRPEKVDFDVLGIYEADVLIIHGEFLQGLTAGRLLEWSKILKEDGQLLLDIPNPVYIRTYLEQLTGSSREPAGLGVPEVTGLLQETGFKGWQAHGMLDNEHDAALRQGEKGTALMKALQDALAALGWQPEKDRNPWVKSFFFKAQKKEIEEKKKILIQAVVGEAIVTPRVRLYEPHSFLATEPEAAIMFVSENNRQEIEAAAAKAERKVFIRHRLSYNNVSQAYTTVEALRQAGYLIVAEMDDNPSIFGRETPEVQNLSYIGTHALQVSTAPLAELLSEFNPHVKVFRNELKELPERRNYTVERLKKLAECEEDYVTFFFGALNRTREWQEVMPAIEEAIRKYGSKLRFKVLSDKGFYEALPTEHKEFIGSDDMFEGQFVPYHMYQEALHSSDISFLPLRDTEFNRTKSDLKFIESAGHGAVVLASPTVYEATVRQGRTGFIYRSPEEFREQLELLVENRDRRLETAEAAYGYVQEERLLSGHYLERLAWYQEMVDRRQELDREMVQRMRAWQEKHPEEFRKEGKS